MNIPNNNEADCDDKYNIVSHCLNLRQIILNCYNIYETYIISYVM